jgi:antirestriction protein ArdC
MEGYRRLLGDPLQQVQRLLGHAAYIATLEVLKNDKRAIFTAAHAQRAADYLHGLQRAAQTEDRAAA